MRPWLAACLLLAAAPLPAAAARRNDGAAETAAGGLRLRKERSVAMAKERLTIAPDRVRVEYEFRNDTDKDVVTEIAFPIPEYAYPGEDPGGERDFKDFRVWVDGAPRRFQTEAKAFLKEKDVTADVKAAGLDIASFAGFCHWDLDVRRAEYQVERLAPEVRARLAAAGILGPEAKEDPGWSFAPMWTARVTYHWTQRFPAKSTVKIAHEYTPVAGFGWVDPAKLTSEHPDAGSDAALVKALQAMAAKREASAPSSGVYVNARWVKYILTTANTWKTPIGEFELRIEKPVDSLVSLAWDGPVERLPGGALRMARKNFVPAKELSVYFFRP
jgi:hypothetical protein